MSETRIQSGQISEIMRGHLVQMSETRASGQIEKSDSFDTQNLKKRKLTLNTYL